MMKHLTLSLALAVAMMAVAVEAKADSITGGISFIGFKANPSGGSDWSTATGVDFTQAGMAGGGTGSYASVIVAVATFNDFTFEPVLSPSPVLLWTFDYLGSTYSFDLETLTDVERGGTAAANSVDIYGLGKLHITGFDDTDGTFVFTGNGVNNSFSFSASSGASSAVPEPASVFLLGTGLLGIGALVQRRNRPRTRNYRNS